MGLGAIVIVASLYFFYDFLRPGTPEFKGRDTEALELTFAGIEAPIGLEALKGVKLASTPRSPSRFESFAARRHDQAHRRAKRVATSPAVQPTATRVLLHDVVKGDSLLRIGDALALSEADLVSLLTSVRASRALRRLDVGQRLSFRVQGDQVRAVTLAQDEITLAVFARPEGADEFVVSFQSKNHPAFRVVREPSQRVKALAGNRAPAVAVVAELVPRAGDMARPGAGQVETRVPSELTESNDGSALPKSSQARGKYSPAVVTAAPSRPSASRARPAKLINVAPGDSLYSIFRRNGYSLAALHKILASGADAKRLKRLRPGQQLELLLDDKHALAELVYRPSESIAIRFVRNGTRFSSKVDERKFDKRVGTATVRIQSSLLAAASAAGLPDSVAAQLVEIFGWDVDFALDIRRGAEFTVLYEKLFLEGRIAKTGAVLAASFVNRGETFKAVRYEIGGRADYFTPQGARLRRAFIRTPVRFARISSRFTTRRRHPVLHRFRAHKGVDYAAPHGTPIRATGDGRIVHLGRKGGYGKAVKIQHGGVYTTLYAHLSRYAKKLRRGSRVRQGQTIGYVGSTGLATGPHLHYEFRVRGVHRNPLTVPLPRAGRLNKAERSRFLVEARAVLRQLDSASQTTLAQADPS